MIICRNCGKELTGLISLHQCCNQPLSYNEYCDTCGELKQVCLCGIVEDMKRVKE